jgi:hypothetical protein
MSNELRSSFTTLFTNIPTCVLYHINRTSIVENATKLSYDVQRDKITVSKFNTFSSHKSRINYWLQLVHIFSMPTGCHDNTVFCRRKIHKKSLI